MLSVQTNLGANTALKNLNTNTINMNNSLNKLSSGFRINNAADDAAGFAVSSKLDSQTQRLKAASLNASQAQAMVKMADSGVNEIQNMVNRIQTLATQASSANNGGELGKLDAERIKLESAINKIATGTNFNGINLLDGTAKNMAVTTGVAAVTTAANLTTTAGTGTPAITTAGTGTFTEAATFTVNTSAGAGSAITSVTSNVDLHDATGLVVARAGQDLNTAAMQTATGMTFTAAAGTAATLAGSTTVAVGTAGTAGSTVANFQVGANNTASDKVGLNLANSYTTGSLGLGTGDLTSQVNAQKYMDVAKVALNAVVSQRADLGATQNQVAFMQSNLATSIEQTTAAVSTIKDADMATQMAQFTKNKILSQVGTSMLAQANQAAQNVMSLFR